MHDANVRISRGTDNMRKADVQAPLHIWHDPIDASQPSGSHRSVVPDEINSSRSNPVSFSHNPGFSIDPVSAICVHG